MKIIVHILRGQALFSEVMRPPIEKQNHISLSKFASSPVLPLINVLIADDNELCRKAIIRIIEKHTSLITACEDGKQAFEAFKKDMENYSLVILDYQMPQMSGLEVIASIREHEKLKKTEQQVNILCKIIKHVK